MTLGNYPIYLLEKKLHIIKKILMQNLSAEPVTELAKTYLNENQREPQSKNSV